MFALDKRIAESRRADSNRFPALYDCAKYPNKYPVGYTMTLRECARFMIKESDNTAELMLNRYLGEKR